MKAKLRHTKMENRYKSEFTRQKNKFFSAKFTTYQKSASCQLRQLCTDYKIAHLVLSDPDDKWCQLVKVKVSNLTVSLSGHLFC
jgi:hypothetical protein